MKKGLFDKIVCRAIFYMQLIVPAFFMFTAIWMFHNDAFFLGILFLILLVRDIRSKTGIIQAWKSRKEFFEKFDIKKEELNKRYSLKKKRIKK